MDWRTVLIEATDRQLEGLALRRFRAECLRQLDNKALSLKARENYRLLANKLEALMDLRKDWENANGSWPPT